MQYKNVTAGEGRMLLYNDANKLYYDFSFRDSNHLEENFNTKEDAETGYFLEVDMKYASENKEKL